MGASKHTLLGNIGRDVRNNFNPNKELPVPYIGYEHIDQQTLRLLGAGISNETQSDKKKFKSGDIIFGTLRPYFRKVIIPAFDGVCSSDLAVIRAREGYDQRFLFYILASQPLIDFADVSSNGTKMPRAKWSVLSQTEWIVPSLSMQQRVGSILGSYDDLIEINNQRIKLLEETTRELYKEWFVRMRFPGYKKAKFEKGIPMGWDIVRIDSLYKTSSGGTPSREKMEYYQDGIYSWIKTGELTDSFIFETDEKISEHGLKNSSAKLFPAYTVIFAMYGNTIGKLGITTKPSCTNQACCALIPLTKEFGFEFLFLTFLQNRNEIISFGMGAAQQNVNQDEIKKFKILKPTHELAKRFKEIVNPFYNQIENLQQQNTQLRQIRDRLLPRLISGKLKVKAESGELVCP